MFIVRNLKRHMEAFAFANDLPNHNQPGYLFLSVMDDGTISGINVTYDYTNDSEARQAMPHVWRRQKSICPFFISLIEAMMSEPFCISRLKFMSSRRCEVRDVTFSGNRLKNQSTYLQLFRCPLKSHSL